MKTRMPSRGIRGTRGVVLALLACWLTGLGLPARAQATGCQLGVDTNPVLTLISSPAQATDRYWSVTLRCSGGGPTPYSITADWGQNSESSSPRRRMKLQRGGVAFYLRYALQRAALVQSTPACSDTSNFDLLQPIVGSLSFVGSGTASVTWTICQRVLGTAQLPASDPYQDVLRIVARVGSAQYSVLVSLQAATPSQCSVRARDPLTLRYRSFQPGDSTASTSADVTCNLFLPWSAAIEPTGGNLMGLAYSLSLSPTQGLANGWAQPILIQGRVPGGQIGICSSAQCSARQTHALVITY